MKQKRFVLVLSLLLAGGIGAVAATQGSAENPLVTLSYLESVFSPRIVQETQNQVALEEDAYIAELDQKVALYLGEIQAATGGDQDDDAGVYRTVELNQGASLTLGTGTEFVLREGPLLYEGSGEVLDTTEGTALSYGDALSVNHLYLNPAAGGTVKAQSDVLLLVRE